MELSDNHVDMPLFIADPTATSCAEGTLKIHSCLVHESRSLKHLDDSDEDEKDDTDRHIPVTIDVTQSALDDAARLLEGGEPDFLTDDQWRAIANIACWLDIEPLEQAVIRHYKKLLVQDPAVVSKIHSGIAGMHKRIDVSLAGLVLGKSLHDFGGKDVCIMARQESLWKTVSLGGHCKPVCALAVFPDGRLASGSFDWSIKLWNTATGACTATLTGHSASVFVLAVLPDGRLASGSCDNTVKLWNTVTKACTATLTGHSGFVKALAVLPDGRLASGSSDHTIKLWNTETNACTATLNGHFSYVWALAVLPDGRLASGSWDRDIKIWDTATKACTATLTGHYSGVNALVVLPDGRLASGSTDKSIKLWNTATNTCTTTLKAHSNCVTALAVLPDGRLASGSDDNGIKLWNLDTGACGRAIDEQSEFALAVLPDGRLASGPSDGCCVTLWNTVTTKCTSALTGQLGRVETVAVLPDGRIAVAYENMSVCVWSPVTCECEAIINDPTHRVSALVGLPDGRLACGSYDSTVRLWVISTKTSIELKGHDKKVKALAVLPDGILASASWDSTIRLWDTVTCTALRILKCELEVVNLAVLSDGYLAAHETNAVRVWRTDTYERVPHLDLSGVNVFGPPSTSEGIATWTQRLKDVVEKNRGWPKYSGITAFAVLPDCRTVKVLNQSTVEVEHERFKNTPFVCDVVASGDRSFVVVGITKVFVLQEVPSRANVLMALTAIGLPCPYILKIMT